MSAIQDGVHGGADKGSSPPPGFSMLATVVWIMAIVVVADVVVVVQRFWL
jgi:hypothetical protein